MSNYTRAAVVAVLCAIAALVVIRHDPGRPVRLQKTGSAQLAASPKKANRVKEASARVGEAMVFPPVPRGPPIAQQRVELAARADRGDAAAASLLAQDLHFCWWMLEQANVQKPDYRSPNEPRDLSAEEQQWINNWEEAQDFVRRNASYCEGIEASEIDRLKASALLAAAKLGDEEAAVCFTTDTMFYARPIAADGRFPAERDDPELAEMYDAEALQLAEAGVIRGDWRMVSMLDSFYSAGSSANPFGNKLAAPNGEKAFLYGALRELGVTDPAWLERIKETPMRPSEYGLSEERARDLRAGAQQLFDSYFRDSGPLPENLALCDM